MMYYDVYFVKLLLFINKFKTRRFVLILEMRRVDISYEKVYIERCSHDEVVQKNCKRCLKNIFTENVQ